MIIYLRIGELGFLASLLIRSNGDAHRQEEYERDEHKKEPTPKKYFNFSSFRPQGTALFIEVVCCWGMALAGSRNFGHWRCSMVFPQIRSGCKIRTSPAMSQSLKP